MCSIAKESAFQFTNPVLKYLEFQLSEVFSVQPDKETVSVQTKLGLSIKKDDVLPEAIVDLSFELGEKNDNCPFYVHAIYILSVSIAYYITLYDVAFCQIFKKSVIFGRVCSFLE